MTHACEQFWKTFTGSCFYYTYIVFKEQPGGAPGGLVG